MRPDMHTCFPPMILPERQSPFAESAAASGRSPGVTESQHEPAYRAALTGGLRHRLYREGVGLVLTVHYQTKPGDIGGEE